MNNIIEVENLSKEYKKLMKEEKKEKILEYVEENKSYFQHMNVDSYRALGVFLNSEKWLAENNIFEREGSVLCGVCASTKGFDKSKDKGGI